MLDLPKPEMLCSLVEKPLSEALLVGQAELKAQESAAAKWEKAVFGFAKRGKVTVRKVNRGTERTCIYMSHSGP